MARGAWTFKPRDVTRAVKAVVAAGMQVRRVELDSQGRIVVVTEATPPEVKSALDMWRERRGAG
jgi:hypothetical protein